MVQKGCSATKINLEEQLVIDNYQPCISTPFSLLQKLVALGNNHHPQLLVHHCFPYLHCL